MIMRRTSNLAADSFDPTPLLLIPAILIQNNKGQSRVHNISSPINFNCSPDTQELLVYTETVLRVTLNRFHVTSASLLRLLHAVSTPSKKSQGENPASAVPVQLNNITSAICEILADGLRMKTRVLPSTLAAILEVSQVMVNSTLPILTALIR